MPVQDERGHLWPAVFQGTAGYAGCTCEHILPRTDSLQTRPPAQRAALALGLAAGPATAPSPAVGTPAPRFCAAAVGRSAEGSASRQSQGDFHSLAQ